MAFKRVKGGDDGFESVDISSITVTAGDLLAYDRSNNVAILATNSSSVEDLVGVAVEDKTTSDTSVLVQKIQKNDEYLVDTTNNSTEDSNYERMVLTDEATVNNTGTDSASDAAVFMQLRTIDSASDKKIVGRFVTVQDRA